NHRRSHFGNRTPATLARIFAPLTEICDKRLIFLGDPGRIRTCDPLLRRLAATAYRTELSEHSLCNGSPGRPEQSRHVPGDCKPFLNRRTVARTSTAAPRTKLQ